MKIIVVVLALWVPFRTALSQAVKTDHWFVPDHGYVQYAGSIGLASVGIGYDVFRKHRLSVHYGHVPPGQGGGLNIMASKLVFNLYSIRLSDAVTLNPLDAGVMLSYHFGEQFHSRWPKYRYPEGYYWWRTSLRAHLLTQTSVTFELKDKQFHSLTAYVELNTNELYLITYLKNLHALTPFDVFKVGVGVRIRW